MLKLKVRIWIETGCNEPEETDGYIEGYSGDRVLVYIPKLNALKSIFIEGVKLIGYEEVKG
nr:MAG TPA: hypothetical protein [Caudoviricetes sp.]